MALQLNTSHPLYSSIECLIGVDTDGTIKDFTGNRTLTIDPAVTVGTSALGQHFLTSDTSTVANGIGNALGITLSSKVLTMTGSKTLLIVTDSVDNFYNRGAALAPLGLIFYPAILSTGNAAFGYTTNDPATFEDSGVNITTGSHSVAVQRVGGTSMTLFVDGSQSWTDTDYGSGSGTNGFDVIGGAQGNFGYMTAKYVWVVAFNAALTPTEISDLHASLGANNTFALIESTVDNNITSSQDPQNSSLVGDLSVANTILSTQDPQNSSLAGTSTIANITGVITSSQDPQNSSSVGTNFSGGIITTTAFRNNTGTLQTSLTGLLVVVLDVTDGSTVLILTNQSTDSVDATMSIANAAITPAVSYAVIVIDGTGTKIGSEIIEAT